MPQSMGSQSVGHDGTTELNSPVANADHMAKSKDKGKAQPPTGKPWEG